MLSPGAIDILTFAPLPIKGPENHQVSCVSHGTLIQIVFLHFQPVPLSRLICALEEARDQMRMDIGGWGSGALGAHPCWERTHSSRSCKNSIPTPLPDLEQTYPPTRKAPSTEGPAPQTTLPSSGRCWESWERPYRGESQTALAYYLLLRK